MKYKIQFFNEIEWVDSTFFAYTQEEAIRLLNFLKSNCAVQYKLVIILD
jgi:hypothetical protein